VYSDPLSHGESHDGEAAGWSALYTRYQHEKAIAQILTNKGFDVFLPLYPVEHRWKDRNKRLLLPLFPCYVFLHGGLERRLDILVTPGIHRFVETGNQPAVIPEVEIQQIREAIQKNVRVEPYPFLKCGDWVRVKAGPLEGLEGFLVRRKTGARLVLSVELLGRSAAVEVDASVIERGLRPRSPATSPQHPYHALTRTAMNRLA